MTINHETLQENIATRRHSTKLLDSAANQSNTWERRPPVALRPLAPSQNMLRPDVFLPPPPVSRAYQTSLPQTSQRSNQQSSKSGPTFGMLGTPQSLPRAGHETQVQGGLMDSHESLLEKQAPSFNFTHYQSHDQLPPSPSQSPASIRHNDQQAAASTQVLSSAPASASTSAPSESESESPEEIRIPEDLPDPVDDGTKPPYSYAMLIGMAILRSPERRLTLAQIYSWINDTYSWYKSSTQAWQNSIRHNLSLNKAFQKQQRPKSAPGKGNYWIVVEGYEAQFAKPLTKRGHPAPQLASQQVPQAPQINAAQPAPQLPTSSEKQSPVHAQHSATSSISTTSSEEPIEIPHAAKQRLPPLDQLTAEGSGSLSAAAYGQHSDNLGISPHRLFSGASEPNLYASSPSNSSYMRPTKRAKLGPRDPFVFDNSTDYLSLTGLELMMSPQQSFNTQTSSATRLPPPIFASGLTNDATMASPRTSLRNHRAQIRHLTASSFNDGHFLSPRKDSHDDQENKFWGPSLAFGNPGNYHSMVPSSPQNNQASQSRGKFLHSVEQEYQRSRSPEGHYEHDNTRRPLSDQYLQTGTQLSVFVTPMRHPFDTPIRDQQYAFSPMKGNPASGSPRR